MQVNIKGSTVNWEPKIIIFTCPDRPESIFTKKSWNAQTNMQLVEPIDDIQQLLSRIGEDHIVHFEGQNRRLNQTQGRITFIPEHYE
jgi:hypothetical protein